MRHAFMYAGSFEKNFMKLTTTTTSFQGSDGQQHAYAPWPDGVDGLRIFFMEKTGKKFVVVRIADGTSDVVLHNEMVLVPGEHFGFGVRLQGTPTVVDDNIAVMQLLEDATKKNVGHSDELLQIRARFKAANTKH